MTLVVAGALYLVTALNALASSLAVVTVVVYIAVYTPLKRRTPLCTLVGAVAGAFPTLIGWAAVCGRLDPPAWVLFAVVFLWQFPHFMAIAWIHRKDYARAGFRVLPRGGSESAWMAWQATVPAGVLMLSTGGAALVDGSARVYTVGFLLLGAPFVWHALSLARERSNASARRLLFASLVHLPLVLMLLVTERTWPMISVVQRVWP
jgi:protoheme IX farnesyltransferase